MAEIIGSAAIEIKAKDKNFENEVRKIAGKIKKVEVPVDAVVNTDQAKKQLEAFRKSQQSRRLKLYVDVDTRKATTTLNKFVSKFSSKDIKLGVDVDTSNVLEAATLLDDFEEQYHNRSIDMDVNVRDSVKDSLDDIKRSADSIDGSVNKHIQLDVDSAGANAQLITTAALAQATRRAISAPMRMDIDPQTLEGIKGFFYTLTGGIPVEKVKGVLTGISANFEGLSVKTGIISSGVASMVGTLSHAVGDLLTIGGDVTQVVGLLNAAPAGIAAGGLALTGTILGWRGFGEALVGEGEEAAKALALLPPEAQKAVKSLDGMGSSIRTVTQTSYWRGMGTAVQDVAQAITMDLHEGMEGAGQALGGQMAAIFGSIQEFGESGGLSNTFDNLTEFFKTSTPALDGFTSGFLALMEGGSRDMPTFGSWLSELGQGFESWAKEAESTGLINEWIGQGTQRMKELGKITQATYGVFSGLTASAREAGMNGLPDLASGMVDLSNAMNSRPFQEGLTSFFSSVRVGAANALPGVEGFFEMIGEGLPTINQAMEDSGTITGNMFENFTRMFENGNMGKGFLDLLDGMKDATATLEPGFEDLGNAIGGAMEVSGEVVRNVAPGLNELFSTLDIVINNTKDGIKDAMPVFNEFVQGLLAGVKSILDPVSSTVGGVLSTFAGLPSGIQTALMSVGAVLGGRAWLQNKMKDNQSSVGNFANSVRGSMSNATSSFTNFGRETGRVMQTVKGTISKTSFAPSVSSAFIGPLTQAQTKVQDFAKSYTSIWQGVADKNSSVPLYKKSYLTESFKNASAGIGQTAKNIGGQITKGLGSALGGVMGILGGPWGIAISAGVAGLAILGQASADQKQRVEDLYKTLSDQGDITSGTKATMAEQIYGDKGSWLDATRAFFNLEAGGQNVGKTLDEIGVSSNSITDSIVRNGSEALDVWDKLSTFSGPAQKLSGEQLLRNNMVSDDDLRKIGMAREEFAKLNATGLNNLSGSVENVSDDLAEAIAKADNMKKSFTDLAKSQILDNRSVLESANTSLEEKMNAFKSNLKLGNLEQLSGQQSFYQLGQVTEQNTNKLKDLRSSLAETGASLKSTFDVTPIAGQAVAMFDMTSNAGRQMYDLVSSQADGIHQVTVGALDNALKQGQTFGQATQQAMTVAKSEVDKFSSSLRDAGLNEAEIATILDTAGLTDKDITLALKTEGIDTAIADALRVDAALQAFNSGDYTAVLSVADEGVKSQIESTLGLAKNFSNEEFQAKLSAKFTNQAEYNSWMNEFLTATPDKQIQMLVDLEDGGAEKALESLLGKGDQINGKTFRANAEIIAKETGIPIDDLIGKLATLPPETIKHFRLESEGDPVSQIQSLLQNKEFVALLKTQVEGDPRAQVESKVGNDVEVGITPKVTTGPTDFKALLGLGAQPQEVPIQSKMLPPTNMPTFEVPPVDIKANVDTSQATSQLGSIQGKDISVNVTANESNLNSIRDTMNSLTDKTVTVTVNANESNLNTVRDTMNSLTNKSVSVNVQANESNLNAIKSSMDALTNKNVSVNVTANESNLNSIRNTMNSITNKTVSVNVKANSGGIQQIQSAMNSLVSKSVSISIKANVGPVNSIRSAMSAIVNKNVTVSVAASTAPVNALRAAISGIVNKTVTITANAPTAAVMALRAAIAGVSGKTVSVIANTNVGAVYAMRSAIASVQSKTVTVTTRTRTIGENANGGVYHAGVRTFARGGFNDPRITKAIERAQRRSGSENHTAQIARGSNNYRVWGEPETGGEAYIPLALSKRLRSLKILEQVASHFGVSLSQYADGGLIGGNKVSSNVTTFASGGTTKKTKAQQKAEEAEKKRKEDLKELNKTIKESISDLKKSISEGLGDLKTAFGQADRSPVQKALDGMRKGVRDFKSETTKQIKEAKKLGKSTKTMSAQLKASSKVDKQITKQMYSSGVWNRKGSNLDDSKYIANDAQRRQKDRRADYNSKYTMRDYERAIAYIGADLEKQKDKYDTMVKNHTSNMESISGNLFKQFDIGSLVKNKDEFGYRPPTTAREVSSYAKKMLSDMKKFKSNLGSLRKAGYNEAIINQISQMSLEEALVVSQALLSDKSQMKSINSAYTQMFGKNGDMNIASDGSTYVGGLARSIGKGMANKMFQAGIDTQKGLVDGLSADVKALEKAGQTMADALVKSFKKALKIKSPSRVFMALGKFIPQGLTAGIDSGQGAVDSSISNLVQPRRLNIGSSSQSTNSSGIINGNGSSNPVTVNVYPSEGMSEKQVGTTAAREIYYRMDSAL